MQQNHLSPTHAESSRKAARPAGELVARLNYTIPEAAHALGIGRSKFYELISSREIATIRIGGRRLVPVDELRAFQATCRQRAA